MEKKRSEMVLMNTKPYEIIVNMQIFVSQVSNPFFSGSSVNSGIIEQTDFYSVAKTFSQIWSV